MKKMLKVQGLDCAHCAAKLENILKEAEGINDARVNFILEKIMINAEDADAIENALAKGKKAFPDCVFN